MHIVNSEAINFEFLESLPTVTQGQGADVKVSSQYMKILLTRTGYDYIREAIIEIYDPTEGWQTLVAVTQQLIDGQWIDCDGEILQG